MLVIGWHVSSLKMKITQSSNPVLQSGEWIHPTAIALFTRFESIRVHWAPIQYNNYPRNYLYTRIVVYIGSSFLRYMDADFGKKNE